MVVLLEADALLWDVRSLVLAVCRSLSNYQAETTAEVPVLSTPLERAQYVLANCERKKAKTSMPDDENHLHAGMDDATTNFEEAFNDFCHLVKPCIGALEFVLDLFVSERLIDVSCCTSCSNLIVEVVQGVSVSTTSTKFQHCILYLLVSDVEFFEKQLKWDAKQENLAISCNDPTHANATISGMFGVLRYFLGTRYATFVDKTTLVKRMRDSARTSIPIDCYVSHMSVQKTLEELAGDIPSTLNCQVVESFHKNLGLRNVVEKVTPGYESKVRPMSTLSPSPLERPAWHRTVELPRPLRIAGVIVHGFGRGSTELGIPTANINTEPDSDVVPFPGVYYGRSVLHHDSKKSEVYHVMSCGYNPFYKNKAMSVEVHLFGVSGDLYEDFLEITVIGVIRAEANFPEFSHLVRAIQLDCEIARKKMQIPSQDGHELDRTRES